MRANREESGQLQAALLHESAQSNARLRSEISVCCAENEVSATWPIVWTRAAQDYPSTATSTSGWEKYFADVRLGREHYGREQYQSAWTVWDRARETAEALGSPSESAGRLRSLAFLDLQGAQLTRAETEIERARALSQSVDDATGLVRADYLEALLLERRYGPIAALLAKKRYIGAIEASRANGDNGDADSFALLLASLLAESGSADEAHAWLEICAPTSTASRAWIDYAVHRAYVERAAFEHGEGSADAARLRDEVARTFTVVEAHPQRRPSDLANLLADLVRFDLAAADFANAEHHLVQLEKSPAKDDGVLRVMHPLLSAEVELARGRSDKAIRGLRSFQAMLERTGESGESADQDARDAAEALIGDAFFESGRRSDAERAYRRAIDSGDERARALAGPRARASYRAQFVRAEQHLIELLLDRRALEEAFEVSEWIRVRSVLDLTAYARIAQSPESFRRYAQAYVELHARYPRTCSAAHADEQKECQATRVRLDVALDELNQKVWGSAIDPRVAHSFRALELSKSLPKRTAMLTVATLDGGRTASFFVRDGAVRAQISAAGADPIAPWLDELAGLNHVDRLYVSPNHRATFDLPMRSFAGGVLGARLPIVMFTYGADARPALRRRGALIVADPSRTLMHAAKEGAALAERLPGATLLIGEGATRARVLEGWNADIVHFAGHAELVANDVWRPTLHLAGADVIALEDVLASPPNASLVVLNACGSGIYQEHGAIGLPEVFGRAADYVLASASPSLDDGRAHAFVDDFYAAGVADPPEAYRRALEAAHARGEAPTSFRLWAAVRLNHRVVRTE